MKGRKTSSASQSENTPRCTPPSENAAADRPSVDEPTSPMKTRAGEVEHEKTARRSGDHGVRQRKCNVACHRAERGIGTKTQHRHPRRKAIHAVHEVIKIDHPHNVQQRCRAGDCDRQGPLHSRKVDALQSEADSKKQKCSRNMRRDTVGNGHGVPVIEKRDNGHHQTRRPDPDERLPRFGEEQARGKSQRGIDRNKHGDTAAARLGVVVQRPLVRHVEDIEPGARSRKPVREADGQDESQSGEGRDHDAELPRRYSAIISGKAS